jgi:acyl carrier protein
VSIVAEEIYSLVKEIVNPPVSKPLTLESLLLEEKMMDSFGLIQLVAGIEEKFSISIDTKDLTSQNFASINTIMMMVEGYINELD